MPASAPFRLLRALIPVAMLLVAAATAPAAEPPPAPASHAPDIPRYPLDATRPRAATPVQTQSLEPCLCRKLLAAAACKDPSTFTLVRSGGGRFVFSAFYGAKQQQFTCDLQGGRALLSSRAWRKRTFSAEVARPADRPCLSARLSGSLCDTAPRAECCAGE